MSATPPQNLALESLEVALATDALPVHARKAAQRLLVRLNAPVRCVILGLPNSGKSKLLNLLAGSDVIPDGFRLPLVELCWAETQRTTYVTDDASTIVHDGLNFDAASIKAAKSVRIEANLPMLKRLNLIEVGLNGTYTENAEAVDWACGQADIMLWCSQEFSPREEDLWAKVSDALKDHSLLVLTKADLSLARGTLSRSIQSAQDNAADDFHSIFPVATLQAIRAMKDDSKTENPALVASGGKTLIAAVMRQAQQGRIADMDSVFVFLNRHGPKSKRKPKSPGREPAQGIRNDVTGKSVDKNTALPGSSLSELASAALVYLGTRASGLNGMVASSASPDPSQVLKHCGESANGLADIVADQDASDPALAGLIEELLDAAELLLLMEMEAGKGPAADAVTVLLQVRRGLECRLAA